VRATHTFLREDDIQFYLPLVRAACGRMLVQHAQRFQGELTLDVNEQNPAARKFYEACGFVVEGRSELDGSGRPYPLLHMRLAANR
jgi:putative acetyltransferase